MTDAHFHRNGYDSFLDADGKEMRFAGVHPWQASEGDCAARIDSLAGILASDPRIGVGEIGLDRLKTKAVPDAQRQAFARQLELAAEFRRPVVLHGAKCWGEVVAACRPYRGRIPSFLFHGFSRSAGLLPEMFAMNGFVSVGPALLNDHAVNYRELAALLPPDRMLVETDLDDCAPDADRLRTLGEVYARLAELRGLTVPELAAETASNLARFAVLPG